MLVVFCNNSLYLKLFHGCILKILDIIDNIENINININYNIIFLNDMPEFVIVYHIYLLISIYTIYIIIIMKV